MRVDPLLSSEAEIGHLLEGRSATLERGGDWPAGLRGTLERGGDWSPARGGPSSEAEIGHLLEGDVNGPHAGLLLSPSLSFG